jgi:hypothetical protein
MKQIARELAPRHRFPERSRARFQTDAGLASGFWYLALPYPSSSRQEDQSPWPN